MSRTTYLHAALFAVLATTISSDTRAGDKSARAATSSGVSVERPASTGVARKPGLQLERAEDWIHHLFDNSAELEATRIEFKSTFQFSIDQYIAHWVEADIRNIDTVWSGTQRTWEIYSIVPTGNMYGISLVDQGFVPPLAPGETFHIYRSLPLNVNLNAAYVLILSPGDANPNNDIAVDQP